MGKKNSKTPPVLMEDSEPPSIGEHVFILADLPKLAEIVVANGSFLLKDTISFLEMVCRVRLVSFYVEVEGRRFFMGVIDFLEEKFFPYNETPIMLGLDLLLKDPATGKVWVEEKNGPLIEGPVPPAIL